MRLKFKADIPYQPNLWVPSHCLYYYERILHPTQKSTVLINTSQSYVLVIAYYHATPLRSLGGGFMGFPIPQKKYHGIEKSRENHRGREIPKNP